MGREHRRKSSFEARKSAHLRMTDHPTCIACAAAL
jgi:hypothetical protein